MKKITFFIALAFYCQAAVAQNSTLGMVGSLNMNSPDFVLFNAKDAKNADAFNPDAYAGIDGIPFLTDKWVNARIRLADSRRFDSVQLKINLFEKKVHFKDENGNEKMIGAEVREIEIKDMFSPLNNNIYLSGFGENQDEFYQVITDGKKIGLLKKLNVIVKETKVFNAPNKKEFELQDGLYLYSSGTLYDSNKNCNIILDAFKNDKKMIKYVSDNGPKCNKEKDLKAMVDYYNSY